MSRTQSFCAPEGLGWPPFSSCPIPQHTQVVFQTQGCSTPHRLLSSEVIHPMGLASLVYWSLCCNWDFALRDDLLASLWGRWPWQKVPLLRFSPWPLPARGFHSTEAEPSPVVFWLLLRYSDLETWGHASTSFHDLSDPAFSCHPTTSVNEWGDFSSNIEQASICSVTGFKFLFKEMYLTAHRYVFQPGRGCAACTSHWKKKTITPIAHSNQSNR